MKLNWNLFAGAAPLVVALLIQAGAPATTVLAGVAFAAVLNSRDSFRRRFAERRLSK